ncbi:hypothetical protein FUAX_47550 (plasmid) [Fulvitalea axinellae]|uniref:Putative Se/S carrier protein-like domain-containing protein n=1 Tax=Fulvitalea axinellae TaxID=1182444 RepID=A0AAU9D8L1_9BACT|nr:hypothetical protein FUAX_47550 [Fulvitalea axinellae]
MSSKRYFILFKNIRQVIKAEKYFREKQIACKVMPVPSRISSECGMCLEVNKPANEAQLENLRQVGFECSCVAL